MNSSPRSLRVPMATPNSKLHSAAGAPSTRVGTPAAWA
eukprot:CAMPEP_0170636332 /NCGR_PEP_ID=MMETSP0224-20130122/37739_1 /TAXON_ID=285029 /ORGANISM="Togula jolla, Strain CCCM 725" /LENGTH=37 /DNA_ID= /DNA_START= /DNA_END= /DNA_ORIENTATION=